MRSDDAADGAVLTLAGEFADRDAWGAPGWCAIERSLDLIGTRSAMMLLREAFYGARRFEDLVRRTGLTDAVSAKRLRQLVEDGLLERRPYQEAGARTRQEYVLTDRGRSLFPLLAALVRWGQGLEDGGQGVELLHAGCGARLVPAVRCEAGHDVPVEEAEAWLAREAAAPGGTGERPSRLCGRRRGDRTAQPAISPSIPFHCRLRRAGAAHWPAPHARRGA
jgi:DNA-binding HxlR family transcriptional regulator